MCTHNCNVSKLILNKERKRKRKYQTDNCLSKLLPCHIYYRPLARLKPNLVKCVLYIFKGWGVGVFAWNIITFTKSRANFKRQIWNSKNYFYPTKVDNANGFPTQWCGKSVTYRHTGILSWRIVLCLLREIYIFGEYLYVLLPISLFNCIVCKIAVYLMLSCSTWNLKQIQNGNFSTNLIHNFATFKTRNWILLEIEFISKGK